MDFDMEQIKKVYEPVKETINQIQEQVKPIYEGIKKTLQDYDLTQIPKLPTLESQRLVNTLIYSTANLQPIYCLNNKIVIILDIGDINETTTYVQKYPTK